MSSRNKKGKSKRTTKSSELNKRAQQSPPPLHLFRSINSPTISQTDLFDEIQGRSPILSPNDVLCSQTPTQMEAQRSPPMSAQRSPPTAAQRSPPPTAPQGSPPPTAPQGSPPPTAPQGSPTPTAPQGSPPPTAPQGSTSTQPPSEQSSHIAETIPRSRPSITLASDGDNWVPNFAGSKPFNHIIKVRYTEFWPTFKSIPELTKKMWFDEWKKNVSFDPQLEYQMFKAFCSRGSKKLSGLLGDVRKSGKQPHWIVDDIWDQLVDYWKSEDFKKKCETNKNNRNVPNPGCFHTAGSVSMETYAQRMTQKTGVVPDNSTVFLCTHKRKKDGTWVDKKSETVHTEYTRKEAEKVAAQEKDLTSVEKDELWIEAAGGENKKRRIYGKCSLKHSSGPASFSQTPSQWSSSSSQLEDIWDKKFNKLSKVVHKILELVQHGQNDADGNDSDPESDSGSE